MQHNQPARIAEERRQKPIPFRSMFTHAWDFANGNVERVLESIGQMGVNTICLAGTYHSGWFIHPAHPQHRAFMTEGSVCYFHPHDELYRNTKLRPHVANLCKEKDWFAEVGKRLDHGMRLVSWTIGTHNTRLGLENPHLAQQNVFGDRIPHALCISNFDVSEYLIALCRDLATNHPLWGIQLESFGWLGFAHGHHHERELVGLTSLERDLMAQCVCPACTESASKAEVEMGVVKTTFKKVLDDAFREAPDRPPKHPRSMVELEASVPEIKEFIEWRKSVSESIIAKIKTESLKGTSCRLLLQSAFDPALSQFVDGFACNAYGKNPEETLVACRQATPKNWNGLFQCFVQLGKGVPENQSQLSGIISAVREGGCNGINFYNHSESPPKMLAWLKNVLPPFANT